MTRPGLQEEVTGTRAETHLGVRWVAPVPGRHRFTVGAARCMRETRRDCWTTLVSEAFEVTAMR